VIFTVLGLLFLCDILSLKNDVNVPSKRKKQKKFFWHLEGGKNEHDPEPDPHPDPFVKGTDPKDPDLYQNVTDPEHWC
jgi:hypothetical protein